MRLSPNSMVPLGYQQFTSLASAQSLTVPVGAEVASIACTTTAGGYVRFRDDGTAPTAAIGETLPTGQVPLLYQGDLTKVQFILGSGTLTSLDILFYGLEVVAHPVVTTWDPGSIASGNLTLSNGNLTVTHTNATAADSIVEASLFRSSGLFGFSYVLGNVTAAHTQLGFADRNTNTASTHFLGQDTHSFGVQPGGGIFWNNAVQSNIGITYATGATVDTVVDLANQLIWMRSNGGPWNGNAAVVPGVSGAQSFSFMTSKNLAPAANVYTLNDAITANFSVGPAGVPHWSY